MDRRLSHMFCLMLFSLMTTALFAQQEFSADVVDNSAKASSKGKIYASKDKLRFEGFRQAAGDPGAMIINFAAQTADILIPERKMYFESPLQGSTTQRSFKFFRATDAENACDEWQKMVAKPGGSCHKLGNEVVNDRSTVKYQGTSADGTVSYVWIDQKLRFPVKWESKNGGGELHNLQEGAQPASLFVVPADYQKTPILHSRWQRNCSPLGHVFLIISRRDANLDYGDSYLAREIHAEVCRGIRNPCRTAAFRSSPLSSVFWLGGRPSLLPRIRLPGILVLRHLDHHLPHRTRMEVLGSSARRVSA
jgi:hypothetical protein